MQAEKWAYTVLNIPNWIYGSLPRILVVPLFVFLLSACATYPSGLVYQGDLEAIRELAPEMVDERACDTCTTALYTAAERGELEIADVLLSKGASIELAVGGYTPLLAALKYSQFEFAEFLIRKGADVSARDPDGATTLIWAASENAPPEFIQLLIQRGVSVNAIAKPNNSDPLTALSIAVSRGNPSLTKLLLEQGADPNLPREFPPLLNAVISGDKNILKALLEAGSDVNARGARDRFNPLVEALARGRFDLAEALLAEGADASIPNGNNISAFNLANISQSDDQLLAELIEAGADINVRGSDGSTALVAAVSKRERRFALFLIDAGANLDLANNFGDTALHWAASTQDLVLIEALVAAGANPRVRNSRGLYPFELAPVGSAAQLALFEQEAPTGAESRTPSEKSQNPREDTEQARLIATGSGFFVNPVGHIVTNYHVIESCQYMKARVGNDTKDVSLTAFDQKNDLAVLKSDGASIRSVILNRNSNAPLGESLTVLGYPLTSLLGNTLKLTTGALSAQSGIMGDTSVYQISAPIQAGNSGGPVFDERGFVIGVAVSSLNPFYMVDKMNDLPQNVNYAVKGSTLMGFLSTNKIPFKTEISGALMSPKDINREFGSAAVLLECFGLPNKN